MAKQLVQKDSLTTLKQKMKYGDIQRLVDITRKSSKHISKVLEGEVEDLAVVEELVVMIENRSTKANNLTNRINQLKP